MGSIVLGAAGAVIGAGAPVIGGVVGAAIGRSIGTSLGGMLDNVIFGTPTRSVEGARLADLAVQVSTYGKVIPNVYGNMRMAGNIIWSLPIKETATTSTSSSGGGKGGAGGERTQTTTYSYSVSLAIAICEGEIEGITRAWADAQLLDISQGSYRVYHGTEEQLPDPFIEANEGVGNTPAYRGLAYVVIEDFPLADYGNRIPNFTLEVKRPIKSDDYNGLSTEEMVKGMTIIPGAGEFVYDTVVQQKLEGQQLGVGFAQVGYKEPVNKHTPNDGANVLTSLNQLQATCPNVEWVSLIVTWFGDNLDAGQCTIQPCVEYKTGGKTEPDNWQVTSITRESARQITIVDGTPRYGGTPSDHSVVRLIDELKNRGYKVMLYPMFFMDVDGKPWRGRVSGNAADVASFFTKAQGYNAFITHYAHMAAGRADAFVIGSELIGLTSVSASAGSYPAVDALVSLAATVKAIVGSGTKVTYAADWSEYHHTDGGWYNLDPLWASPHIDMVGIDAYFPLTNQPQSALGYNVQTVIDGWDSGEGYDFFYADEARTIQQPLEPRYAWKNLGWWWSNPHINPNGQQTAWVPQSKKIWFTEYGFPSLDGATNQPNVFYDPASVESFFPRFSNGLVDFRAQRVGITATEARWQGSEMLERMFLWTWDARPFPYFPDLRQVWADGNVWAEGHWVTGKFGLSGLGAIVREICLRAGLSDAQIDVTRLNERVDGYIITRQGTARSFIEELMSAYFFDAVERGGQLVFVPRGQQPALEIHELELLVTPNQNVTGSPMKTRQQEVELPSQVEVIFLDRIRNYDSGTERATRQATESREKQVLSLPIVMSATQARITAEKHLYLQWLSRIHYRFTLGQDYAMLEPTDVITLKQAGSSQQVRLTRLLMDEGRIEAEGVAEELSIYEPVPFSQDAGQGLAEAVPVAAETELALLDIPALPEDGAEEARLRIAAVGLQLHWRGAVLYRDDAAGEYSRIAELPDAAVMGSVTVPPADFTGGNVLDKTNTLEVRLIGEGALQNVSRLALLNGANAALVGEEILQFQQVEVLGMGHYRLSYLLRGRLGTEHAIASHEAGECFILLGNTLPSVVMNPALIGLTRNYKAVSIGATLGSTAAEPFTYAAKALRPYAPVHLRVNGKAGENISLSWVRRDRIYGQWRDFVDAGLAEREERYEVEIFINEVKMRSLSSINPNISYDIAMQASDGLQPDDTLRFKVAQYSALAGKGYSSSISSIA